MNLKKTKFFTKKKAEFCYNFCMMRGTKKLFIPMLFAFSFFSLVQCGEGREEQKKTSVKIELPSQDCNILSVYDEKPSEVGSECFFPFPFTQFFSDGKLSVPESLFRVPEGFPPVELEFVNQFDGFSPASQIMFWHPEGFSREGLPSPEQTVNPTSLVQLIEWDTGERITILVEPDARAKPPFQVLYIRPLVRMKPGRRYVVIVKKGVKSSEGKELTPPSFIKAVLDGSEVEFSGADINPERWEKHFRELFDFAERNGVPKNEILAIWDFPTATDKKILSWALDMRDMIYSERNKISFSIGDVKTYPYRNSEDIHERYRTLIMKSVEGKFFVPDFWDKDQLFEANFLIHIPECVKRRKEKGQKVKVMIFGHGLFGSRRELRSHHLMYVAENFCVIMIASEWVGIDEKARGDIFAGITAKKMNGVQAVEYVVKGLLQGHANFLALALLVKNKSFWDEIKKVVGELGEVDTSKPVYYGISNGGIQGAVFMALTKDVELGTLDVGGAIWTMLLERNKSWDFLRNILFPRGDEWEFEAKKVIAVAQSIFDVIDPISFAPYIIKGSDEFGIAPKKIFYRYSLYDEQVFSTATETYLRTAGIPCIEKPPRRVFGIQWVDASGGYDGSACVQVDPSIPDEQIPPAENIPPNPDPKSQVVRRWWPLVDEGDFVTPHSVPRAVPQLLEMQKRFYEEGKIYQLCSDMICDPN